ncbi:MAG: DUF350 domain-containing protein [Spirochaetes bacterium]|nr:DUF350 domain-containing protein [Spirochaetota bacterium]
MNIQLISTGLIEIGISFATGVFIFFFSFKIFSFLTKDIEEIEELKNKNIAVGILIAAFVFGIMLLVKESVYPSKDTLINLIKSNNLNLVVILISLLRIIVIYIISAFFAFIILWLSIKFFMILTTKIDEIKELTKNNSSVALILASLIVSIVVLLTSPLATFLSGIVKPSSIDIKSEEPFFNIDLINKGFIELIISLAAVLFIFFISFKVFSLFTKKIDEIKELNSNNNAVGVLMAGFNFSMMLLVKSAINPAIKAMEFALDKKASAEIIFLTIGQIILYFIIAAIFAFIILWIAMKLFMFLTTSINEMEEINNKNFAVGLIIAVLLISSALLLAQGLETVLSGMVKTPQIGTGILDLSNFK